MYSANHRASPKQPRARTSLRADAGFFIARTLASGTGAAIPVSNQDKFDMADNLNDVRTRVNDRAHKVLTAVSQASGRDIAEILRGLIEDFVQDEVHRAESITAVLRDDKGRTGTRGGTAS